MKPSGRRCHECGRALGVIQPSILDPNFLLSCCETCRALIELPPPRDGQGRTRTPWKVIGLPAPIGAAAV